MLAIVSKLRAENPNSVILLRGRDEMLNMNNQAGLLKIKPNSSLLGTQFKEKVGKEMKPEILKYPESTALKNELVTTLSNFYNTLPSALFIAVSSDSGDFTNVLVCSNSGIELGINPSALINNTIPSVRYHYVQALERENPKRFLQANGIDVEMLPLYNTKIKTEQDALQLGFLWNSFVLNKKGKTEVLKNNTLLLNQQITEAYCNLYHDDLINIHALFRAHQSTDRGMRDLLFTQKRGDQKLFPGAVLLWPNKTTKGPSIERGSVLSFMPSPESFAGLASNDPRWYIGKLSLDDKNLNTAELEIVAIENKDFAQHIKKSKGKEKAED